MSGIAMVIYNVQTNGDSNLLIIELINDSVRIEASAIAYIVGDIKLLAQIKGLMNKIKAYLLGKSYFKPILQGTGKIYLHPSLGSYHKLNLSEGHKLYVNPQAFVACRNSIEVIPDINFSFKNFVSGTPMTNLSTQGIGSLMLLMPGPVEECVLQDGKFSAYTNNVAAFSADLKVTRETAGIGDLTIAQKLVKVFRGNGTIYFSPNINKGYTKGKKS